MVARAATHGRASSSPGVGRAARHLELPPGSRSDAPRGQHGVTGDRDVNAATTTMTTSHEYYSRFCRPTPAHDASAPVPAAPAPKIDTRPLTNPACRLYVNRRASRTPAKAGGEFREASWLDVTSNVRKGMVLWNTIGKSTVRRRNPEIADYNPLALWDTHFVRELDDSGYIDGLYR